MLEAGVYGLRCLVTGEIYVGSGINWQNRTRNHVRYLRAGTSIHKRLQKCWDTYGEKSFEIILLSACKSHKAMWSIERQFMKKFKGKLLNTHPGAFANYYKHGMSGTRTFKSWDSMLQRCTNKNAPDYFRYGGKGIKVCHEWRRSFLNFMSDMGERPEGTSLDRYPNKNGDYEPDNCRWATPLEQSQNRDVSKRLTYHGTTRSLKEWVEITGIPYDLLLRRLNKGDAQDKIFAPSYSRYKGLPGVDGKMPTRARLEGSRKIKRYTAHGKTLTLTEWAKELGLTRNCLSIRIKRYKDDLEAVLVPDAFKRGPGFRATPQG